MSLTGLTLSSSSAVKFDYLGTPLAAFGDLAATLTFNATETGAVAFGPLDLASFDGGFQITYTGPTQTIGAITIDAGDNLLSGVFLGSIFTGYGSAGGLVDSNVGGGLVSYSSDFLTIDPMTDQGMSVGFTSITPASAIVAGILRPFSATTQGEFAGDVSLITGGGGTPEPATWALMLMGVGGIGFLARRRARRAAVAA